MPDFFVRWLRRENASAAGKVRCELIVSFALTDGRACPHIL
jgi:hypothetical protein